MSPHAKPPTAPTARRDQAQRPPAGTGRKAKPARPAGRATRGPRRERMARRLAAWRRWLRWPRISRLLRRLLAVALGTAAIVWSAGPVYAQVAPGTLPAGGVVISGTGSLNAGSGTLTIVQSSARLGIDWQSFSIGRDALVEFVQPGAASIALNRVVGHEATQIYGRLRANGQVFLTNPNGVLFAPGARVDVGGLVASALDMSQADFAAGQHRFVARDGATGGVRNDGELVARAGGYLALFGATVDNRGELRVDAGSVVLASGRAATVSISGGGLLSAVVDPGVAGRVLNSGRIAADGGSVTLTAASADALASSLVNNSGIVRAHSIEERGGQIWITGDRVESTGALQADAQGSADAGRITLRGGMQGGSLALGGTLSATAEGGRGGDIETSAAQVAIADATRVNTLAGSGRHGTWLIDPTNFTVAAGSGAASGSGIGAATLSANLEGGNVTLLTATEGSEAGDLFVNAPVSWSANTLLTLSAARHVEVNADITATGGSAGLAVNPALTDASGRFSMATGVRVRLPGANSGFALGGSAYTMLRSLADLRALDGSATVLAGQYALADDIDASATATTPFSPIGNEASASVTTGSAFTGRLQGLGNAVLDLRVDQPASNAAGLFAQLSNAQVENLRLVGGSVTGSQFAGALSGVVTGSTRITNVHADLAVSAVDDSSSGVAAGGLLGSSPTGVVTTVQVARSSASGDVSVDTSEFTARAGGLIGNISRATLSEVSASGDVSATLRAGTNDSAFTVGGLVGNGSGSIADSSASGNVSGGHESGGLVGRFEAFNATITGSTASGNVAGTGQTGGLVGHALVAAGSTASLSGISNSSASGQVTSTGYLANDGLAGGAVGHWALATAPEGLSASGNVTALRAAGGVIGFIETSAIALPAGSLVSTVVGDGAKTVSAQYWAGGLVGYSNATGTAEGLSFTGSVTTTGSTTNAAAGGLFGRSNGSIRNSTADGNVAGASDAGGLVGLASGAGGFSGVSATATVTGVGNVGGLVGEYNNSGAMDAATASGTVSGGTNTGGLVGHYNSAGALSAATQTGASVTGTQNVGGLIGYATTASLSDVSAGADVTSTGTGTRYVGGLVGRTAGTVSDATASGGVSVTGATGLAYAGGLIGLAEGTGGISDASASGAVSIATTNGSAAAGGLVGYAAQGSLLRGTATGNVEGGFFTGGLVGRYSPGTGTLSASAASGSVSGRGHAGGLVGFASGTGEIAASSAGGSVSSTGGSGYGVGGVVGYTQMTLGVRGLATTATVAPTGGDSLGGVVGELVNGPASDLSTAATSLSGSTWVGGLIGVASNTSLNGLSSAVAVTHTGTSGGAGGVVGFLSGSITGGSATGSVSATGETGTVQVGGYAGRVDNGAVTGITASGPVSGGSETGGLVGRYGPGGGSLLSGASATGEVSGRGSVGGLVGVASGTGGISASSATGSVATTGPEAGSTYAGGAVGHYLLSLAPVGLSAAGNVSGGNTTGGLIGYLQSNVALAEGSLLSVVPEGSTKAITGPRWVGGLVGYSGSSGAVSDLGFTGNVTATGSVGAAGGLMGRSGGAVSDSRSAGVVVGAGSAGGLVGQAAGAGGFTDVSSSASVTGGSDVGGLVGEYSNTGALLRISASGSVSGGNRTGGLIGVVGSAASINEATYTGSSVSAGTFSSGSVFLGGLFGDSASAAISNATVAVSLSNASTTTLSIGGLAGRTQGSVSASSATGSVSATGATGLVYAGGLIGQAVGSGSISGVSATGAVSVASATITSGASGGLIGWSSQGDVSDAQASGNVSGQLYVGGLIGRFSPSTGSVSGSTATGNVSSLGDAGGLVGFASGTGSIDGSSASGNVTSTDTGSYSAGGAVGYTQQSGGLTNLTVGGSVTGAAYTGGIVGYLQNSGAAFSGNSTSATNVTGRVWVGGHVGYSLAPLTGLVSAVNVSHTGTGGGAGGLVGYAGAAVTLSGATGSVTSVESATGAAVGGLIGNHGSGALSQLTASGNVSGGLYTGGLVGYSSGDTISEVAASGTVATARSGAYVGGLAGFLAGAGAMTTASATGAVTLDSGTGEAGGLVGRFSKSGGLDGASATGAVSGGNHTGGLIAYYNNGGDLRNATATGAVSGNGTAGGLVGELSGAGDALNLRAEGAVTAASTGGGLFGAHSYGGRLEDSVATGHVVAGGTAGGLIGSAYDNGPIVNSRAGGNVRGGNYVGGLVGNAGYTRINFGTASGSVTMIGTSGGSFGYVGGLVGQFYDYDEGGGIFDSSASGQVIVDANGSYAGGLVGYHFAGSIEGSRASGSVTARDGTNASSNNHRAGGLAGQFSTSGASTFVDNRASGDVQAAGTAGGLVAEYFGSTLASSVPTDVQATGAVSGRNRAGGLFGELYYVGVVNGVATGNVVNELDTGATGGLAGIAYGYYGNSQIIDSRTSGNVSGGTYAGGLLGQYFSTYASGSTSGILASQATGSVGGATVAGGLVGRYDDAGTSTSVNLGLRDSFASGNVSASQVAGGLVGQYNGVGGIQQSRATGEVRVDRSSSGGTTLVGGLVGEFTATTRGTDIGRIERSTASGAVVQTASGEASFTGNQYAGGLVGRLQGPTATDTVLLDSYATGGVTLDSLGGTLHVGGLVGSTSTSLARTYATGAITVATGGAGTATLRVGGLVGHSERTGTTASASYWASDDTGVPISALGTALTLEAMRDPASFEGWDIATTGGSSAVWRQYAGRSLPLLRNFLSPLTLVLGDVSRAYDGTTGLGVAPIVIGDVLVSNPAAITVFGDARNVGAYTITGDNLTSTQGGYDLVLEGSATLSITQRPLTLSGVVLDKVYDGTTTATLAASPALGNLVQGEDLRFVPGTGFAAAFETRSAGVGKTVVLAGSYSITDGEVGRASNYALPSGLTTTATITPRPVTVGSISAVDRAYDGTTVVAVNASAGTLSGVLAGDAVAFDPASVTGGSIPTRDVGTRPVTVSGATLTGSDAGNYRIEGLDGITVLISPRQLTMNGLVATDRRYNAGTSVSINGSGATLAGVLADDLVLPQTTGLSGRVADKNVGDGKPVTVSGAALRGTDAGNYSVVPGEVTVNISPALLTVDLFHTGSSSRVYDGSTNAAVAFYRYGFGSDDLTISATSIGFADKNVAYDGSGAVTSKTITASGITLGGADAANYALQNSTATINGTITPKPLAVSGVTAVDRVYDGTRNVQVDVGSAVVDTAGVIAGDEVNVSTPSGGGTVTGQVETKNVGTNKPVAVPGLALTGADAGNYSITGSGSGVTVDITAKDVTASYTGQDKVYDGSAGAVVTATLSGVVAGDVVDSYVNIFCTWVGSGCAVFTNPGGTPGSYEGNRNAGTDKPVLVLYNDLRGTDAANYRLVNANGAAAPADVTPKPVTLAFSGGTRAYDGGVGAPVTLSIGGSGLFSADGISTTQTAVFTGDGAKNVGSGKAIAVSDIVASGAGLGNYTILNTTATASGSITPKAVVVSGINATNRPYDGGTTVAVSVTDAVGSTGFVAGDAVSITLPPEGLSSGTVATPGVGTAKPVTVTGLGLGGADATNYRIDLSSSGITVDITPKLLTPSFAGQVKVYDGGVNALVSSTTEGILAGDTLTFGAVALFTGTGAKNVGSDKPIAVSAITLGGPSAANYGLASTTATTTGTVVPKTVTPVYTGGSRVYSGVDDRSAPVNGSSPGFVGSDAVRLAQTALFAVDGSAGTGKAVSISDILLVGADAGNYVLASTSASTTATVTPRPLAVTGVTATSRVYDGTNLVAVNVSGATVDTSGVVPGDSVGIALPPDGITTGTMADRFVGAAKPVTISGAALSGASAANYELTGASGLTVNITPRPLTATYAALDKVYDGSANASVVATPADLLSIDAGAVGVQANGVFVDGRNAGTGKAVSVSGGFLTGAFASNYTLANPGGSATASITPRTLGIAFGGISKVYDGGVAVDVTASLSGRISGDAVGSTQTAVFTGDGAKNVGTGKPVAVSGIVLTGADAGNYRLESDTLAASGSITPRPITISGLDSVVAVDRVYDGSTSVGVLVPEGVTLTPGSSDIVAGDSVTIAVPGSGLTTGTMADKHAGTGKAVAITGLTLSGADAANYVVAGTAGVTVDIARLGITALWSGVNRLYDGSTDAQASGSSDGLVAGDSVLIRASGSFSDGKNVGTAKPITFGGGTLSGSDAGNYALLNPSGTASADVTPRTLSASFGAVEKVYDGGVAAPVSAVLGGLVAGDSVGTAQTAVFTGAGARNVGADKPVSISDITLTGTDAGNYLLAATTASTAGRITPRPVTLVGLTGVTAVDRVYDGSTEVEVSLGGSGPVSVDPASIVAGDEVGVTALSGSATTGTMADRHVGSAKPVVVNGLDLTGADAANYRIAATEGVTVNITPRPLLAAYTGVDKVYDGTASATVLGSSADILAGDSVAIGGGAVFAAGKNVGTGLVVDVTAGALSGADARNYSLDNPTGSTTASILPREVTAAYTGGARVYDGTVLAPVNGSLEGLVEGDTVTLSQSAVFTGLGARNAGADKPVAVSGIALGGADAANYLLTGDSAITTASITPRPLRIVGLTGVTAVDRPYDGTREVVVNVSTSGPITPEPGDLIEGDEVTLSAPPAGTTTGLMADKHVGEAKPVAVSGLAIGGADAGNYSVAATSGVTVSITPRALTPVFIGTSRVYDGGVAASAGGSSADILAGDSVGILGSGVFTGEGARNAGLNKPVSITSALLTGADAGNYRLTTATGSTTADITPRTLTASYTGIDREYDGGTAVLVSRSLAGLVDGDSLSISESAAFTDGRNVGTAKPVLVSGITLAGTDAGNYLLGSATTTTTASVTPRLLTVTGLSGLTVTDRVYDGTLDVGVSLGAGGGSTGASNVVPGDDVSVAFSGAGGARMLDKHAGSNKPVTLTGLTLAGADAGNYLVGGVEGLTVNIAPRPVSLAGVIAIDRVYDGSTLVAVDRSGATISGAIAGDVLEVAASATGTLPDKAAGSNRPVSVAGLALAGADAGNYVVTDSAAITVNIAPREISAVFAGLDKVYDGSTAASVTISAAGLVAGDDALLAGTAVFTGPGARNAGTAKPIGISDVRLSGADAGNYLLTTTGGSTTASILPRTLSAGVTVAPRVYDGTTTASVSLVSSGVVDGDAVTLAGTATYTGPGARNVGVDKPVTVAGLTLGGADAGNYTLGGITSLVTTGSITPRPLALTVTVADKVYDGDTVARVLIASDRLAGDDLVVSAGAAAFERADAGSGLRVDIGSLALAGADRGNYSLPTSLPAATGNILRAPLLITAGALEKVYGTALVPLGTEFSAAGLVGSQTVGSVALASAGFGALQPVTATPYELVPSAAAGGSFDPANYDITYGTGTLTVRPRPVTISSDFVVGFENELSRLSFSASVSGLLVDQGHALLDLLPPRPVLDGAPAGSRISLLHSGGRISGTEPGNYELRYQAGQLIVLPRPVQLSDPSEGGGDGGFGIGSFTQDEIDAAAAALQEALRMLNAPVPVAGNGVAGPGLQLPGAAGTLTAAEIAALFGTDARQITLPALQRLPLISLDPTLRRLLGGGPTP